MKVPLQLGLRRLLLILATCAAWFAYWGNESQRSPVNANLIRTLRTTRSLPLQDTSKLTCQMTSFQGRSEWSLGTALNNMNAYQSFQCYAPHSGWEICISTRDFPAEGFPIASHVTPLNKGTSKIELSVSTTEKEYEINVLVEGTPAFVGREDKTWSNAENLRTSGNLGTILQSDDISPIQITRLNFANMKSKDTKTSVEETPQVTNGVLIWLRKIGDH